MENLKVGCVLITTNEYKELVLKEKELEAVIDDCETQISKLKERYKIMEEYIVKEIYDNEQWDIKQLEFKDGIIVQEYHYKELYHEFIKRGITDDVFISDKILEFYRRYVEAQKEEETNE